MASNANSLGAISVEVRADWSKLASDFSAAESAAARAGSTIAGSFTASVRAANGLVDQFGRSLQAEGAAASAAAPQNDKLAASVQALAGKMAAAATTQRILTDALQNSTAASIASATATQATAAGVNALGSDIQATLAKMAASAEAGNRLREVYLSIGLAVRTVRIAELVYRGAEAIYNLYTTTRDAGEKIQGEFHGIEASAQTANDELQLSADKVANVLAKLSGTPEDNLKVELDAAAVSADHLADSLSKVNAEIYKTLKSDEVSQLRSLLTREAPTAAITKEAGGQTGFGGFEGQRAALEDKYNAQIRGARDAKDAEGQLAAQVALSANLSTLYANEIDKQEKALKQIKETATQIANIPWIFKSLLPSQDFTSQIELITGRIHALKDEQSRIPQAVSVGNAEAEAARREADNAAAARGAQPKIAASDASIAAIKAEDSAWALATDHQIKLAELAAKSRIALMDDVRQRALADAQAELKAAQDRQAGLAQRQRIEVPGEISATQARGDAEQQGKLPEQQQSVRIETAKQVAAIRSEAAKEQENAAFAVAEAEQKVNEVINQGTRELNAAIAAYKARVSAATETAAAERQILEIEGSMGLASKASGQAKIDLLQEEAAAQKAIRDGAVASLQAKLNAETDDVKKLEESAEIQAKILENDNKDLAAKNKINAAVLELKYQLAELAEKGAAAAGASAINLQKAQVERASALQTPSALALTPNIAAQEQFNLQKQIAQLDEQQREAHIADLKAQADIAGQYKDQYGQAKLLQEAQAAINDNTVKTYEANTKLLELLQEQSLQYQVQKDFSDAFKSAQAGIGQGIAAGVFNQGKHGEDIGTQIEKSLRNVGQQLLGNLLTQTINRLVSTIVVQTGLQAAWNAIFPAHTATQVVATTANTTAVAANTAAVAANTAAMGIEAGAGAASGGAAAGAASGSGNAITGGLIAAAGGIIGGVISGVLSLIGDRSIVAAVNRTTQAVLSLRSNPAASSGATGQQAASTGNSGSTSSGGGILGWISSVLGTDAMPVNIVRISPIAGAAGLLNLFGLAGGGSVPAGAMRIVGEKGPELFVPEGAGTVIPNGKFSSASGMSGMPSLPAISGASSSSSSNVVISNMHLHGVQTPKELVRSMARELPYLLKAQGGPAFSPHSRSGQGPGNNA